MSFILLISLDLIIWGMVEVAQLILIDGICPIFHQILKRDAYLG